MSYKCDLYRVIEKKVIARGVFSYTIYCPQIIAKPGQFVHVKIDGFTLRRPISICDFDKQRETIRIVFEVRGRGTEKLSELNENDNIDLILPLGNGFNFPEKIDNSCNLIFVGGGIGVPPIYGAAKSFAKPGNREQTIAILGFRNYEKVILMDEFEQNNINVTVCTEDGSVGEKGYVTKPLERELTKGKTHKVYACGPVAMLKTVTEVCKSMRIPCEVSMEQRMGCGVGACAVCTCITKKDNEINYLRVCKDGPVFNGEEVVFDEM